MEVDTEETGDSSNTSLDSKKRFEVKKVIIILRRDSLMLLLYGLGTL